MIPDAATGWQGWSRIFGTIGQRPAVEPLSAAGSPPKKVHRRPLPEPGESQRGRGDLWATRAGKLLHATDSCCLGVFGMPVHRQQVKDFPNPRRFDGEQYRLCRAALDTAETPERAA